MIKTNIIHSFSLSILLIILNILNQPLVLSLIDQLGVDDFQLFVNLIGLVEFVHVRADEELEFLVFAVVGF